MFIIKCFHVICAFKLVVKFGHASCVKISNYFYTNIENMFRRFPLKTIKAFGRILTPKKTKIPP